MLEQLQQMIAQSPQLWMQGLGQAERMGERNRLYAIQNSQNFSDALLQLAGIVQQQEQSQAQMGLQQRGLELQENEAGMRAESLGIDRVRGQAADRRAQEASQREGEAHGLRMRSGEYDLDRAKAFEGIQMRMAELGIEDAQITNQLNILRRNETQAGMGDRLKGAGLDVKAKEQGLEAGAQQLDANAARTKWEERFRAAKTDEERDAIVGENVEMYFRGREAEKDRGLRSDLAGTGKPGESGSDFVLKELRERSKAVEQKALGGTDMFGKALSEPEVEVARRVYKTYQKAAEVADTPAFPRNKGESDEAYLNRLLGTIARSIEDGESFGAPAVGGPSAPAPAQADDPFGIGG